MRDVDNEEEEETLSTGRALLVPYIVFFQQVSLNPNGKRLEAKKLRKDEEPV